MPENVYKKENVKINCLGHPPSLLSNGYWDPSLGCEADHTPPASATVKNVDSHIPTVPICLHGKVLI